MVWKLHETGLCVLNCCCLQLMSLWSARLEWNFFLLIAKTSKISKLVTSFTLKFLCRALKTFHMCWISTLWASILVLISILRVKTLLIMTWHLLIFITNALVTWLSWLDKWLFLLALFWWKLCAGALLDWFAQLLSHQPLVWHVWQLLLNSILFASYPTLLAAKFSKSTLPSFMVLDANSSSH